MIGPHTLKQRPLDDLTPAERRECEEWAALLRELGAPDPFDEDEGDIL
jgi:hypothetical protein